LPALVERPAHRADKEIEIHAAPRIML